MAIILLLFIAGLILIFLEFFLPGAVLAILGMISLLTSCVLSFMSYPPLWGILYLFLILLCVFCTCKLAVWKIKRSKSQGDFYHGQDQEGYAACVFDLHLVGKQGTVSTELKPAGHILIEGQLYQALSETGFLAKGTVVKIVGGKGSHLIVRG
jgi:membrane-bound serine protease (ClpP class)